MRRHLMLSYLLIIGVTVGLLVVIVHQRTAQNFSRYLSDQSRIHSRMLPIMLASYYFEHHSWEGVQRNIDDASLMIGSTVVLANPAGQVVAATQRELVGTPITARLLGAEVAQVIPVVSIDGTQLGIVYVDHNPAQQRADQTFLNDITSALVAASVVVALVALVAAMLLARSISQPLAAMAKGAAQIAQGDYQARVAVSGNPEVVTLATAFNQMATSVGSLETLRHELVTNVSHDLRTPLTVIRGYLEGLRSGQIADRRSAEIAFEAMHLEVSRLLRMVDNLRQVARYDAGWSASRREPVRMAELVDEALQRVAPLADTRRITIQNQVSPDLPPLYGNAEQLGQALFNLLENSINYSFEDGQITIRAAQADSLLCLELQDTGSGIPPEHQPHVFERFYRADASRSHSGMGIGLSIVRSVVEAHGGTVSVASPGIPGEGTIFTLTLPFEHIHPDCPGPHSSSS